MQKNQQWRNIDTQGFHSQSFRSVRTQNFTCACELGEKVTSVSERVRNKHLLIHRKSTESEFFQE